MTCWNLHVKSSSLLLRKKKKKTLPIINMEKEKEKEKDRQCPFAFGLFEDGFSSLLCYISEKTIYLLQ
jgi:hypothetical protein